MSLVKTFDKYIIYRAVRDVLIKEEAYNKNKSTISGLELFQLFQARNDLMQEVLEPVKDVLSREVDVKSIYFIKGMRDDTSIAVKYLVDGAGESAVLSKFDNEKIEIIEQCKRGKLENLIDANSSVIDDAIRVGIEKKYDTEIHVPNAGNHLLLGDDDDDKFGVYDTLGGCVLELRINYPFFEENGKLYLQSVKSPHGNIAKFFTESDENITKFLSNVRVYEGKVPILILKK